MNQITYEYHRRRRIETRDKHSYLEYNGEIIGVDKMCFGNCTDVQSSPAIDYTVSISKALSVKYLCTRGMYGKQRHSMYIYIKYHPLVHHDQ